MRSLGFLTWCVYSKRDWWQADSHLCPGLPTAGTLGVPLLEMSFLLVPGRRVEGEDGVPIKGP